MDTNPRIIKAVELSTVIKRACAETWLCMVQIYSKAFYVLGSFSFISFILSILGSCPRGKNCTFAHSISEIETYRHKRSTVSGRQAFPRNSISSTLSENVASDESMASAQAQSQLPPIARVGPLPRGMCIFKIEIKPFG